MLIASTRNVEGTRIATVATPPDEEADGEDLVLSVRELGGNGSGTGADLLSQQWHTPPLQQQHPCLPQQECRVRDAAAQCGHLAAVAASARAESLPQSQAIAGRVSTGTRMAASHTRAFAAMVLQSRISPPCYRGAEGCRRLRFARMDRPIDTGNNSTLPLTPTEVNDSAKQRGLARRAASSVLMEIEMTCEKLCVR